MQRSSDSNEEALITAWYTSGANRISQEPDYYFLAYNPNDPIPLSRPQIERTYNFWGRVYVDGIKKMDVFSKNKLDGEPQRLDWFKYSSTFDDYSILDLNADDLLPSLKQSR